MPPIISATIINTPRHHLAILIVAKPSSRLSRYTPTSIAAKAAQTAAQSIEPRVVSGIASSRRGHARQTLRHGAMGAKGYEQADDGRRRTNARGLRQVAHFSGFVVLGTDGQVDLVAKVSDQHETWGPLLMQLAHAKDKATLLKDIIGMAEARLAVALAVVEGPEIEAAERDA